MRPPAEAPVQREAAAAAWQLELVEAPVDAPLVGAVVEMEEVVEVVEDVEEAEGVEEAEVDVEEEVAVKYRFEGGGGGGSRD